MTRALTLSVTLLAACTQTDGPARVAWDRDTCRGCSMALSDKHFAAQVRGGPKNTVEKFDDLGCAVKWLAKQPWANDATTQVWVARSTDGEWLNARKARFIDGQKTPMAYGWGAVDGTESGIDFETLRTRFSGTNP